MNTSLNILPRILFFAFILFLISCGKESSDVQLPSGGLPPDGTIILFENVINLSQNSNSALTNLTNSTLEFSDPTEELQMTKVGDILIGSPTDLAPSGYLRRITAIDIENGKTTFQTNLVTLDEVIEECNISETIQFDWVRSLEINTGIDVYIDKDNDLSTVNDQVKFEGDITLIPDICLTLKKKFGGKLRGEVGISLETIQEFKVKIAALGFSTGNEPIEKMFVTFKLPKAVKIAKGLFWADARFDIGVGFEGEAVGSLSLGTKKNSSYTYKKIYDNNQWETISETTKETEPLGFEVNGNVSAEAYIKGAVTITVFEILGFETYAKYFVRGEAEFSTNNPDVIEYCANHGIKTGMALHEELFGSFDLDIIEVTLSDNELFPCGEIELQPKAHFTDDFNDNLVDTEFWIEHIENGDPTYIREEDQIMKVEQNATDVDTYLKTIPIEMGNEIVLERRAFLHPEPSGDDFYYYGKTAFEFDNTSRFRVIYYKTDYYDGDYQSDRLEGMYLEYEDATNNQYRIFLSESITNEWFDEKIIFNAITNELQYFVNGLLKSNIVLDNSFHDANTFHLEFNSYGWWTGHYHYMDDFDLKVD